MRHDLDQKNQIQFQFMKNSKQIQALLLLVALNFSFLTPSVFAGVRTWTGAGADGMTATRGPRGQRGTVRPVMARSVIRR